MKVTPLLNAARPGRPSKRATKSERYSYVPVSRYARVSIGEARLERRSKEPQPLCQGAAETLYDSSPLCIPLVRRCKSMGAQNV